jgi:glycosyltransferase involved in cell wall biosynthesis
MNGGRSVTAMRRTTRGSDSRLRILQVVSAYYPAVRYGGPIRSVHGLSAALARRGHDVHVYTTSVDGAADSDVPLDRPVEIDGVNVHYFRVPALRRLWWSPDMGRRLRASVHEFDAVHVHAVFLWPMFAAARAAARAGVPYVIAPRGMLVRDVISRKSRWVKNAWIYLVERESLARAAAIHVTAELEGRELQALGLPAPHMTWIPNGVQWPAQWQPLDAGPYAHLPAGYALFLSRISWKKGLERLITAWQWVPDIPLVIAGNDDEDYQPRLVELARSLGLTERVIFLGAVSDAHKWALYSHARLFVLPSYSENFGNVVAEAMAMGCPVAVTPEVGIASLVESTGAGIVVPGAAPEFAAAVRDLLSNPSRLHAMGERGKQAARERLSWDAVAAQTEDLYRQIIGRAEAEPQTLPV